MCDARHAGHGSFQQNRTVRAGNIGHGQPFDWRIQAEERILCQHRRDLRAEACSQVVFVDYQTAARLVDRCQNRRLIPRRQGSQIEYLGVDS